MKARVEIFQWSLACAAILACPAPRTFCQADSRASATARILVWVRDARGAPVSGLNEDGFVVTEHGLRDRVVDVEALAPRAATSSPATGALAASDADGSTSQAVPTYVLVVIPRMGLGNRHAALDDAVRYFSRPISPNWRIALLDDEGMYVPFRAGTDKLLAHLEELTKRLPKSKTAGSLDQFAIRELGIMPGRHVVVVLSDYGNEVNPSTYVDSALRSNAAVYPVQISGPGVTIPIRQASDSPPLGPASGTSWASSAVDAGVADQVTQENVNLGELRGDALFAADETGGRVANDLKEAFERIEADAAGCYLVRFEPDPNEKDGTWHPFSVSMRKPGMQVKAPKFYLSPPFGTHNDQIPAEMKRALSTGKETTGLDVSARAWLFPSGDVHTGVFAAEVKWTATSPAGGHGSRLKVFAEIINLGWGGSAGSWYEERDWPAQDGHPLVIHWQREAPIFPGSYTFRVVAMDTVSSEVGTRSFPFFAHAEWGKMLRFSGIMLGDSCLSPDEKAKSRRSLFDPLQLEECTLAPAPSARFGSSEALTLLIRLYPPDQKTAGIILKAWKAYAFVDDADDKATELQIAAAEVRGIVVFGKLRLNRLELRPGKHRLSVLFVLPGNRSKVQPIPLRTEFSVEP